MSDVDKRVVKFEFDNRKFERNVKQSMSTLDKLKERLNFSSVSNNLDKVSVKISALEVAAVTAIANISNRLVNLGITFVKSLSVDNVSAGWTKFGNKTISVGTMAAQAIKVAGKSIDDYSEKMEVINEQLDKLLWFSDETSYNFTDMINTVGQFTAAGQDLDKSVDAIMGIANWAAKSGKNAQTASHAMFQLAQAMGRGYIMGQDWMSIQTAGMATSEFKQRVLDSAVAMKELNKVGNEYVTKTGKKISATNFDLSSRWFKTDILVNALGDYSAAIEDIYKIAKEENLTAYQVIEKYGDKLDKFGVEALKASQEARTFTDAINAMKDAVSTGWMVTAESIFGSYDEAKVLWSELADQLYKIFVEGGNFRNEVLNTWNSLAGRADLFKHGGEDQGAFWNIYDSIVAVIDLVKGSFNDIFPKSLFSSYAEQVKDVANRFKQYTKRLQENTKRIADALKNSERLRNIFRGLFSVLQVGLTIIKAIRYALDPIITVVIQLGDRLLTLASNIGISLQNNEKVISKIVEIAQKLSEILVKIIDFVDPVGLLENLLYYLGKVLKGFGTFTTKIIDYSKKFITYIKDTFKSFIESIKDSEIVSKALLKITNAFSKLKNGIVDFFKTTNKASNTGSSNKAGGIGGLLGSKRNNAFFNQYTYTLSDGKTIYENESKFTKLLNKLREVFVKIKESDFVKSFINLLKALKPLMLSLLELGKGILKIVKSLTIVLMNVFTSIFNGISKIFSKAKEWNSDKYSKIIIVLGLILTGIIAIGMLLTRILDTLYVFIIKPAKSLAFVFDSLSYVLDNLARKLMLGAISRLVRTVALALLEISVSFILLDNVGTGWLKGGAVLLALIGTIIAVTIITRKLNETVDIAQQSISVGLKGIRGLFGTFKNFKGIANLAGSNVIRSISYVIDSLGRSMLALSIAFRIFDSVDTKGIVLGSIIFGTLLVGTTLMLAFSKKMASVAPDFRKAYPGIMTGIAVAIGAFGLAKALQRLSEINFWKVIGALVPLSISIVLLGGSISALIEIDKERKEINKVLWSFAAVLTSLLAFAKALEIMASLNFGGLMQGVLAMTLTFVSFSGLMAAIYAFTKGNIGQIDKVIYAFSVLNVSLIAFALAMKILSNTISNYPEQVSGALLLIIGFIAAYAIAIKWLMHNAKDAPSVAESMKAIRALTFPLLAFSAAVALISSIKVNWQVYTLMATFTGILIAFGFVVKMISKIDPANLRSAKSMIGFLQLVIIDFIALGITLAALSKINWVDMIPSTILLTACIGSLIGLTVLLSRRKEDLTNTVGSLKILFGMVALIVSSGIILAKLSEIPFEKLAPATIALISTVTILVNLTYILAKAKGSIKESLKSIALLGSLVLSLYAISHMLFKLSAGIKSFESIDWKTLGKVGTALGTIVGALTILSIIGSIAPIFIVAILGISAAVSLVILSFSYLIDSVTKLFDTLHKLMTFARETGMTLREVVAETISNISLGIVDSAEKLKLAIVTLLTILISALSEALLSNLKTIQDTVYGVLITLLEGLVTYGPIIAEYLLKLMDILQEYIPQFTSKLWGIMFPMLASLWEKVKSWWNEHKVSILATVTGLPEEFFNKFFTALDNIKNTVKNKIEEFKNDIKNALTNSEDTELYIPETVLNPPQSFDDLPRFFGELAGNIERKWNEFWGINSPSKVFEKSGEYMMQGLALGLENGEYEPINAMNNVVAAISDSMNDNINDEIVITPVVDLSKVSEGTRNINSMMDSINGSRLSVSARLANSVSGNMNRGSSFENQNGVINNNNNQTENYYNTFNITSDDPEEVARQTDMLLQRNRLRANLAKGGA